MGFKEARDHFQFNRFEETEKLARDFLEEVTSTPEGQQKVANILWRSYFRIIFSPTEDTKVESARFYTQEYRDSKEGKILFKIQHEVQGDRYWAIHDLIDRQSELTEGCEEHSQVSKKLEILRRGPRYDECNICHRFIWNCNCPSFSKKPEKAQ